MRPNQKFNSIGNRETQQATLALMTRLCGEVGIDGYKLLTPDEKAFIDDVRYKLNQHGSNMFGVRQVARMKDIHTLVMARREEEAKVDR